MKNQITINQLEELINLRLDTLNISNNNLSQVKDPIINWYLKVKNRKINN